MMGGVWFLSHEQFQWVRPGPEALVISISDRFYEAEVEPGFAAVLRLRFSDVDPAREAVPRVAECFTPDQASDLVAWCDRWLERGRYAHVFVHCWAGRSRSAAIAWWISKQYHMHLRTAFTVRFMNAHVLRHLPGNHALPEPSELAPGTDAVRSLGELFVPLSFLVPFGPTEIGLDA